MLMMATMTIMVLVLVLVLIITLMLMLMLMMLMLVFVSSVTDAGPGNTVSNHHSTDLKRHRKLDPLQSAYKTSLCLSMILDIRGVVGTPAGYDDWYSRCLIFTWSLVCSLGL